MSLLLRRLSVAGAFELDATAGTYVLTGAAADVLAARMLVAAPGSYTLTGQTAELLASRVVAHALTADSSTTDGTSFATASIAPTGDRLVLLAVVSSREDSINASAPSSVTGNGLTWVQVATVAFDVALTVRHTLTVFRALGAAPSAGAVTINFAATHSACTWSVIEFSGVDTGGTDGSAAVVQSVTASSASDADGILTVTLAAFESASNATYGAFGANITAGFTAGSGFTEIHDVTQATPTVCLMSEFRVDNDTSVDATRDGASSPDLGGIAIEIKAGTPGFTLVAAPGSYVLTGVAAAPLATRLLNAVSGSYVLTGSSTLTSVGRYLTVDPGAYTITGAAADLAFAPAGGVFSLNAAAGVYTLTGVTVEFTRTQTLTLIDHVGSTLTLIDHPETH